MSSLTPLSVPQQVPPARMQKQEKSAKAKNVYSASTTTADVSIRGTPHCPRAGTFVRDPFFRSPLNSGQHVATALHSAYIGVHKNLRARFLVRTIIPTSGHPGVEGEWNTRARGRAQEKRRTGPNNLVEHKALTVSTQSRLSAALSIITMIVCCSYLPSRVSSFCYSAIPL